MQAQKKSSLLKALYIKEIKRYFASNIYVLNTLIGYILMVAIAVMLAFTGIDKLEGYLTMSGGEPLTLPFPLGNLVPFLLSLMLMMGSTTASSISMEGKQWWIPKSLPIPARTILDSKMLVGLSLMLPAVLISGAVLVISGQTRRRQSGLAVSGSRSLCLFFRGIRDHGQSEDAGIQLG